ncbi:MAG: hypothetical protein KDC67_07305 [Ignavibacteriae bacterium]|nr:hypothetical protein [Ignavibacteriota bacterium]
MMQFIIIAIIVLSSIWVYIDATSNKIGKIRNEKNMLNMSAGSWSIVTLGIWIIGFPAYILNRSKLIKKAKEHPIEPRWRFLKSFLIIIFGAILLIYSIPNSMLQLNRNSPIADSIGTEFFNYLKNNVWNENMTILIENNFQAKTGRTVQSIISSCADKIIRNSSYTNEELKYFEVVFAGEEPIINDDNKKRDVMVKFFTFSEQLSNCFNQSLPN